MGNLLLNIRGCFRVPPLTRDSLALIDHLENSLRIKISPDSHSFIQIESESCSLKSIASVNSKSNGFISGGSY